MPKIQTSQIQPVSFKCRFEMTAADARSSHEFCVFDFPGCEGCPKAKHFVRTVGSSEDPIKSEALRGWIVISEVSYGDVPSQGEPYAVQEASR
jgi:hypothetical protein